MMRQLLRCSAVLTLLAPLALPALGAQHAEDGSRLKIGATTLAGIVHVGIEQPMRRDGRTFQWDLMLSPWQSVDGYPFTFVLGIAEWRFYREARPVGWYAALDAGGTVFRLQRADYRDTTLYQEGVGVVLGGSVGRVWRLRSGWSVDAYLGGGTIQSLYKGYDRATGRRYDGAELWNISGELYPFRTGVMLGLPRRRPR